MPATPVLTGTPGDKKAILSWTNEGPATYKVQRLSGNSWNTIASQTGTNFTDTGLTNGLAYRYRVRAGFTHGPEKISNEVSVTPYVYIQPITAPTLTGTVNDRQVSLSWGSVPNAVLYNVRRQDTSGSLQFLANTAGLTYTDAGLTNGTAYVYAVKAQAADGTKSPDSNLVSLTPMAPTLPPLSAPVLSGTAGDASAFLGWDAVTGANFYRLKRAVPGGSFVIISGDTTQTTYQDTSLTNDQTYIYNVRAFRNADNAQSPNSNDVSLIPESPLPDTVAPVLTAAASSGAAALSWNIPSSASSFAVQQGPTWNTIAVLPATQSSYAASPLTNDTTYSFRLRTTYTYGVDRFSNEVSVTPTAPTPQIPASPSLSGTTSNASNTLTWNAITGATGYRLRRFLSDGSSTVVYDGIALTYTDTAVSNGTSYDYRATAYNSAGGSPYSNVVTLTPSSPVSTTGVFGFAKAGSTSNVAGVTGGEGGTVIDVNNWAEFATAIQKTFPRIIKLHGSQDYNGGGQSFTLKSSGQGNFTVDGSDFSGQLTNYKLVIGVSNTIWRYLRLRTGEGASQSASADRRSLSFNGSASSSNFIEKHLIDHCSIAWGPDVIGSFINDVRNCTIQFSIIGPCLYQSNIQSSPNGYGWNTTVPGNNFANRATEHGKRITFYKNLYVLINQRMLKFEHGENIDAVNNVIYDYGNQAPVYGNAIGENIIGNIFKKGPQSQSSNQVFEEDGGQQNPYPQYDNSTYWTGNLLWDKDGNELTQDWSRVTNAAKLSAFYDASPASAGHGSLVIETANQALFDSVVDGAGALPSDAVDLKMKNYAKTGTSGGYYNGPSTGKPPFPF